MKEYKNYLEKLKNNGQFRELNTTMPDDGAFCKFNEKKMFNLSSNDYLGLNNDSDFKHIFFEKYLQDEKFFPSSTSSRLLTGNLPFYDELEKSICRWFNASSCVMFNSGYHANMGILPALTNKDDLIIADKFCHASLIDGILLSNAQFTRFSHNNMGQLERILVQKRERFKRVFIVTESIFSMDGDRALMQELVGLKDKYQCLLYVDEAHAIGAIGESGRGLACEEGLLPQIDILVAPLGKAMSSLGAFVLCNETLKDMLINHSRTLIFTTALAGINLQWSQFVVDQMPTLAKKREHLKSLSAYAIKKLQPYFDLQGAKDHILPIVVHENHLAIDLAKYLRSQNILVFPIRPPTVPKNSSRIRISLSANMRMEDLDSALEHIIKYKKDHE